MHALIGWTGFVGSELLLRLDGVDIYNSSNIHTLHGKCYDRLYFAGLPAEKWKINKNPEDDRKNLEMILSILETVEIKQFILISTVDVLDAAGDTYSVHPYGVHRRRMEEWVEEHSIDHYIFRLPSLFGPGLKKNILYDLLFENNLELIAPESEFQWYNIAHLYDDIELSVSINHRITHLTSIPIRNSQIIDSFFPEHREKCRGSTIIRYSCTVDSHIPKRDILLEIKDYICYERQIQTLPITLSISNIAWSHDQTKDIMKLLRKYRIQFVELAPTTVSQWGTPITEYPSKISGLQSILYNTGIHIFETPDLFIKHYQLVAELASNLKGKTVVFGSPKQRHCREGIDAISCFRDIASISDTHGVVFCIEPNSEQYGCTWLTTIADTIHFIRLVDRLDSVKLNVDTGNYIMENDTFAFDEESVKLIGNVQVSNEMLLPYSDILPENRKRSNKLLADIIENGYSRNISLEMKQASIQSIARSIHMFVHDVVSLIGNLIK